MGGHIQKREDRPSPWRARYRPPRGREISRSFRRRVDAERWLREQRSAIDQGAHVHPRAGETTFAAVAERWLDTRKNRRPSTRARDRSLMDNRVLPAFGDRPIKTIQPSDLQAWIADLSAELAPSTVRKCHQIAAGVFKLAVRDRLIAISPARDLELPAARRDEPRFITADDVFRLADHVTPAMIYLGAFAGLRVGEVLGLQVSDIGFLNRRVTVRQTASEVRGKVIIGPPKTPRSRRTVTVPAFVIDAISEHLAGRGSGLVFTASEGGPIRRVNWSKRSWSPAVTAAGLDPLRFHDLRHSHVAMLIEQGEHPRAIADRLGLRRYRRFWMCTGT